MEQKVRAALYARVSDEEQVDGYSIDAQKRAFHALIQGRGWVPGGEYVDEGRSARTDDMRKRPMFKKAIYEALAGKYDVLVVHKIDRFSRNLKVTVDYLEKLAKAGVGFVSIQQQMDYSRPEGKLMLVMMGALAEFYSDNLSEETKKGMSERKLQGLYCGSLPFGVMKGEDGVPVPDPATHAGLTIAFELAAEGKSDKEVAQVLNSKGYRTAGPMGNKLFSKHSVRGILANRFYAGYLPDGNGEWLPAKHAPLVDKMLWEKALATRERRCRFTNTSRTRQNNVSSLTGLARCWYCGGRVHNLYREKGEARFGCYNRTSGLGCQQKSARLSVYENQLIDYLETFHIPQDYQQRILEHHAKLQAAYDDTEGQRRSLEGQLKRTKELYEWGDYTRSEYQARKDLILRQLEQLEPQGGQPEHLDRFARFLSDVPAAWEAANQEQRNKLARTLFDQVWLKDKTVVAVKPRPELEPFFKLNHEDLMTENIEGGVLRSVELYHEHGLGVLVVATVIMASRYSLASI